MFQLTTNKVNETKKQSVIQLMTILQTNFAELL